MTAVVETEEHNRLALMVEDDMHSHLILAGSSTSCHCWRKVWKDTVEYTQVTVTEEGKLIGGLIRMQDGHAGQGTLCDRGWTLLYALDPCGLRVGPYFWLGVGNKQSLYALQKRNGGGGYLPEMVKPGRNKCCVVLISLEMPWFHYII